jgi:AcrR family transcriptional regulator
MNKTWKSLKKQGLMDIVVKVLSREGLEGLTMDAVAEEAGVAKGTLYTYFKSKQDLIKEAIEVIVRPMIEELTSILESDLPPDERLKKMITRHLAYFETHRDFFRVFVHDRLSSQMRLKRYRSCHYQNFLKSTAVVLEEGIGKGMFRAMDPLKLAAILVEADIAVINQRLLSDRPGPAELDAALISDVFFRGIQRNL